MFAAVAPVMGAPFHSHWKPIGAVPVKGTVNVTVAPTDVAWLVSGVREILEGENIMPDAPRTTLLMRTSSISPSQLAASLRPELPMQKFGCPPVRRLAVNFVDRIRLALVVAGFSAVQ